MSSQSSFEALPPWVLVCGGFHELGGMDRANFALAQKLLALGRKVFLVGHKIDSRLLQKPNVEAFVVPRPLGSTLLGESSLDRVGRQVASRVTQQFPGARVLVNGGNCTWADINWVHAVNSAYRGHHPGAPGWFRVKNAITLWKARRDEVRALRIAKLVISNSRRTTEDLIALGVSSDKINTVYLGSDPTWSLTTPGERGRARQSLGLTSDARVVCFVGALGYDQRKGFDTLLKSWCELRLPNSYLLVAGGGRAVEHWREQIRQRGVENSIKMLGFTDRVRDVYDASDLLVSPVRYEPFGLNVQEAICRGVPAIVTAIAGAAEVYPAELNHFLLPDAEDHHKLAGMIRDWYADPDSARVAFQPLAERLQKHTWSEMAEVIIALAENRKPVLAEASHA